MGDCKHNPVKMHVAVDDDGLCPLCQKERIAELEAALLWLWRDWSAEQQLRIAELERKRDRDANLMDRLHKQHDEDKQRIADLEADYAGAVEKFDNCRAAIAQAVQRLGGKPLMQSDENAVEWHEFLIAAATAFAGGE